jgi:hypothetical protein
MNTARKATAATDAGSLKRMATLEISGVDYKDHTHDAITFHVPVGELQVDYMAVETLLIAGGVPKEHAMAYVEAFSNKVHIGELSRLLAERIKVVG